MRVGDDGVLQGVVFIGAVDRFNFTPLGTGFLAIRNDGGFLFQYLVTARHVIERIAGDKVHIRANLIDGNTEIMHALKADWRFHPNTPKGHYIDVAVLACNIPHKKFDIRHLNLEQHLVTVEVIRDLNIGVGEDVFVVGLFTNHFGASRNIPVVRCGTIATMPKEPMMTEFGFVEGYLIETLSLGGLSGSPVFVQPPPWRIETNGHPRLRGGNIWYFLGLMCGHWLVENPEDAVRSPGDKSQTSSINTGMGIVVPVSKIVETIDQPELADRRAKIIEGRRKESNFSEKGSELK